MEHQDNDDGFWPEPEPGGSISSKSITHNKVETNNKCSILESIYNEDFPTFVELSTEDVINNKQQIKLTIQQLQRNQLPSSNAKRNKRESKTRS